MALYDDDLYAITALKQRHGIVGFTTMGLVLVTELQPLISATTPHKQSGWLK